LVQLVSSVPMSPHTFRKFRKSGSSTSFFVSNQTPCLTATP